nr:hypothetical protein [Anaerolineae bacterium]
MVVSVEVMDATLEKLWRDVCGYFGVNSGMPDLEALFEGVVLIDAEEAAKTVLVNILLEMIELVDRFSPWYKLPARAYGLMSIRDSVTQCVRWILAPDAETQWANLLFSLAEAIERNSGLLQATQYVGELVRRVPLDDPCVKAACECLPPRYILINQSSLLAEAAICRYCNRPFRIETD